MLDAPLGEIKSVKRNEKRSVNDKLPITLAPLRGVTGHGFRGVYMRHFGGFTEAVAPFIATRAGRRIKPSALADILPENNPALPLVPQAIGKSPAELEVLLHCMRELGYRRCDLNAGCPWPFVVKKGRGAGLLRDAGRLREMLEVGCALMPGGFSIKVRLGIEDGTLLLQRMPVLNDSPLEMITIHPRTARQMYDGRVDLRAFGECLAASRHRVRYNGDIRTTDDFQSLRERFPSVRDWMLGRGALADPFLPRRIQGDGLPERPLEVIEAFIDEIGVEAGRELSGPAAWLGRMKELWSYLHAAFEGGGTIWKRVRVCRRTEDYGREVSDWFASRPSLAVHGNAMAGARE